MGRQGGRWETCEGLLCGNAGGVCGVWEVWVGREVGLGDKSELSKVKQELSFFLLG